VRAHRNSKIALVGQAPGSKVHQSGVPWDDKSGDRLRAWLGVSSAEFYKETLFALVPMGFCYPGKGKTGDLPPRKECAPTWHPPLFEAMPKLELTLLIGSYAQAYYLGSRCKPTLTETVQHFEEYLPEFLPLPHPSPRNNIWLKKNEWFDAQLLPVVQSRIRNILNH
jgi:uracil-DNA glycosylase